MGYELAKSLEGTIWECSFNEMLALHIYDLLEAK